MARPRYLNLRGSLPAPSVMRAFYAGELQRTVETPAELVAAAEAAGLTAETRWHLGRWQTFVHPAGCEHVRPFMVGAPRDIEIAVTVLFRCADCFPVSARA